MPNAPRGHVSTRSSSEPAQNARLLNATYRLLRKAPETRALVSSYGLATSRACMAASNEENDMKNTFQSVIVANDSLFEGNDRRELMRRRNEAVNSLVSQTTSNKASLQRRRAAYLSLAEVYADADDAGLWVGQDSLTGKTRKDRDLIESARTMAMVLSLRQSRRAPSLADVMEVHHKRGEADAAASAAGKTAN
jgi:hypothetical protein